MVAETGMSQLKQLLHDGFGVRRGDTEAGASEW